ncbi:MAG: RnfABCDGE type electron transport complex subunit D [Nanobdellota archaeon]
MNLVKSSSPHIRAKWNKDTIMGLVLIALIAPAASGVYFFGKSALLIIIVSVLTALITDLAMQIITKGISKLINLSSIVTGLLLALILPPTVPLWIPVIGTFFAVAIGKYAFGPGNSIFNPALVGRAILVVSWPKIMTKWINPDGISSATPLASGIKPMYTDIFIGNIGGCIGETSAIALIIGGIFLISAKVIDWKIPATYILSFSLLLVLAGHDPLFHVMAGGILLGAFFMATDYVTIPITPKGRIIFATGCGVLTFLFRIFSSMPEGVMYSILLMNAFVPLIERLTIPKPFGYEVKN